MAHILNASIVLAPCGGGIYIYIYEHEAIRRPKSENNIGAPSAPQKTTHQLATLHALSVFRESELQYRALEAVSGKFHSHSIDQLRIHKRLGMQYVIIAYDVITGGSLIH